MSTSPRLAVAREGMEGGAVPAFQSSEGKLLLASAYNSLQGLEAIWAETLGDERVCVAVLDGPVDLSHSSLRGANLRLMEGMVPSAADNGPACRHGTQVASIIFGQPDGPVPGIAPGCRGLILPIFESVDAHSFRPCSQLDLARALTQAVQAGAHIINVSGGQFSPSGLAHPLLADVVRACAQQRVLIVAAAGNQGCECLHVPAAMDSVLAAGAMNAHGEPLDFSNWGGPYRTQGLLVPGENIWGALPGGGAEPATGTSYATGVLSGVAALLLSLQIKRGQSLDPLAVREALLASARRSQASTVEDGRRLLAGRLNVHEAVSFLFSGNYTMAEPTEVEASGMSQNHRTAEAMPSPLPAQSRLPGLASTSESQSPPAPAQQRAAAKPTEEKAASCGCKGGVAQLVYALGQIGYDFQSEARLDSIVQTMAGQAGIATPERSLAYDPRRLLAYLEDNPWDAASIEWTLSVDSTPLYAIRPVGPFAADGYRLLRRFLKERLEEGVERISVPGLAAGKVTLLSGQAVPVIIPELRGMYSWTTAGLVEAVVGKTPAADGPESNGHAQKSAGVHNFLHRVYHEVRNLGLTPQDRALNYAATNAFEMGQIFESAIKEKMDLDRIHVVPSPIGRPGSDCWDVEVYFFYPERQVQTVRKVYRFTVDVSDNVPVTVGAMRAWFTR